MGSRERRRERRFAERWINIVVVLALFLNQFSVVQQASAQEEVPLRTSVASETTLTPGAREAANLLGIMDKVERLQQLRQSRAAGGAMSDEELGLKVDVLDKIMGGSLEVRMVAGRIDREVAWAFSGQGMLQARKQKRLNYLFTANFMQGGILGTLSGPAFLHGKSALGTELLLYASTIGLLLSTLALAESQKGEHKKMDGEVTVLAEVFKLNAPEPLHHSEIVMKYMASVPPGSKDNMSRVEKLMDSWKRGRYLRSTDEKNLQKLAALQPPGKKYKESVRLLSNRVRMLFDTQYTVEQLDAQLLDLLRATDSN